MSSPSPKRRNHLIWVGALMSIVGLVSYFTFFARFPALRDVPWVNLTMVSVGLAVSILAVRRRLSFFSVSGALLSAACAGLLTTYVFVLSNQLPDVEGVVAVGDEAPSFSLTDHSGSVVSLSDFREAPVIVAFYRGFW